MNIRNAIFSAIGLGGRGRGRRTRKTVNGRDFENKYYGKRDRLYARGNAYLWDKGKWRNQGKVIW